MESAWIDAYENSTANRRNTRAASDQTLRIKIYEREEHSNRTFSQMRPFLWLKFWRKVYDRTAEEDTVYALDGYLNSSQFTNETENVYLLNMSIMWRDLFCYKMDYVHPNKAGRKLKGSSEILKTVWNQLLQHSRDSLPILEFHMLGSNFEELDIPPTIKSSQLQDSGSTATLIDQCDTDFMLVVDGISLGSSDAAESSADGTVETDGTKHGYLRIRLSERFLSQNAEKLAHCIQYPYLRNYYFEAMFYNEPNMLFQKATICQDNVSPTSLKQIATKGPAFNLCYELLTAVTHSGYVLNDFDVVCALKYPMWPMVANEWLHRKRRFGWPSNDLIKKVKSYGCCVVPTSHDLSDRPDIEFRFSFSVAELVLAEELSFEQKQCYVSFKSAIKHVKQDLESQIQQEIKVKSYHLKNVFFWACETIPGDDFQTPSGWTKCFIFLIDQLLHCLREKVLPGYFIPQYNLLDAVSADVLDCLAEKVSALSRNPLSIVTKFLNTLVLYNGLQLSELSDARTEMNDIRWGLKFLQNLVSAFDGNEKCRFWKKSCALDVFASWCKSHLSSHLSGCISPKMSLFDIVYLDIKHQFDLKIDSLTQFAQRETSADVVSKLASCYHHESAICTVYHDSYSGKAMLLFRQSVEQNHSLIYVLRFASFLYDSGKYEETIALLRSAHIQVLGSEFENLFEEAQVMKCIMADIGGEIDMLVRYGTRYLPAAMLIYHVLLICYRQLGLQDAECCLLKECESFCNQLETSQSQISWYMLGISYRRIGKISRANDCFRQSFFVKLHQDIEDDLIPVESSRKCPHAMITVQYFCFMLSILTPEIGTPSHMKAMLQEHQLLLHKMPFAGSNLSKIIFLLIDGHCTPSENQIACMTHNSLYACLIKWSAMSYSSTLPDRLYYSQFLMNCTTGAPALPLLLEIIQKEKKNPMSIIVWPKKLRMSMDYHIRRELDSLSEDGCLIIPTIVYGYYLLATLYLRLMQMDEYTQVMLEFQSVSQDLESVYPLSYSFLGYAYEQSGRYVQAVSSHRRARELLSNNELTKQNLSNAILLEQSKTPVRRSTSNDRTRKIQEQGFEAVWQMYFRLLSVLPEDCAFEAGEVFMKIFEKGRTTDDCYSCRLAD